MPPRRSRRNQNPEQENENTGPHVEQPRQEPDMARLIEERLNAILPNLLAQFQQQMPTGSGGGMHDPPRNNNNNHNGGP